MPLPPLLQKIIDFLRAGYPEGVPPHDYIPLFALLGQRLSDEHVAMIADELAKTSPIPSSEDSARAVRGALAALEDQAPSEHDLIRVQKRLEAVGWSFDASDADK